MSMRRNILRSTLSEDLVWADCLKNNPNFELFRCLRSSHPDGMETRSQASTPERKREASPLSDFTPVDLETNGDKKDGQNDTP